MNYDRNYIFGVLYFVTKFYLIPLILYAFRLFVYGIFGTTIPNLLNLFYKVD